MAEYYYGIKAGVLAGVVYAMLDSFIFLIAGSILLGISLTTWNAVMLMFLTNFTVGAIFGGAVMGLAYAVLYENLPTKSPTTKGIIVGAIFWLIFGLALNTTYLTVVFYLVESFALKALVFGVMLSLFRTLLGTR